jgi:hypothetical protein
MARVTHSPIFFTFVKKTAPMKHILLLPLLWLAFHFSAAGQCNIAIDVIDEFDSTRLVVAQPVSIGYLVPSNYKTVEGLSLVEEAKILFSFTENDTMGAFFLTIAAAERDYHSIDDGYNIFIILSDGTLLEIMHYSDRGYIDEKTLMRIYTHTCVTPVEYFYLMAEHYIDKIRINYKDHKHTIVLSPDQKEQTRQAIRCVGEKLKFYPIRP